MSESPKLELGHILGHVIYKYPLPAETEPYILMPQGAHVLSVGVQRGEPFVWALVDRGETIQVKHWFFVIGTGHPIDFDPGERFLGTILLENGGVALVFHVWDNGESSN